MLARAWPGNVALSVYLKMSKGKKNEVREYYSVVTESAGAIKVSAAKKVVVKFSAFYCRASLSVNLHNYK